MSQSAPNTMANGSDKPKVLILGFGALGTLYGFLLARGGARVFAVARSNAQSLRERGIDLRSAKYGDHDGFKPDGVVSSAKEAREAGPFDYVLCTVKIVPEERRTGAWIREFIAPREGAASIDKWDLPAVIFVENGIGIEKEPHATLVDCPEPAACTIASCCAWLGATLTDGGRTVTHGTFENLEMGLYPPPNKDALKDNNSDDAKRLAKLRNFHEIYTRGQGGGILIEGDIQPKRWTKLLWNAAWGGLTALARQPVLVMLQDENLEFTARVVRKTMLEILYVARAAGYNEDVLPASDIDKVFNLTYTQAPSIRAKDEPANLTSDFKPSILMDLEAGRPFELSPIIKNVVQMARQHNIDTPRLDMILAALHPSLIQAVSGGKQGKTNGNGQS